MTDRELKQLAIKKYNQIIMGNGSELRALKLYNIHALFEKPTLTENDRRQLRHFLDLAKKDLDQTAYVANTVISPTTWGLETHHIRRKRVVFVEKE